MRNNAMKMRPCAASVLLSQVFFNSGWSVVPGFGNDDASSNEGGGGASRKQDRPQHHRQRPGTCRTPPYSIIRPHATHTQHTCNPHATHTQHTCSLVFQQLQHFSTLASYTVCLEMHYFRNWNTGICCCNCCILNKILL